MAPKGQPEIATTEGDAYYNYALSYLPGQRLSACTCTNDQTHPGPTLSNGSFVGRGAPEIDMFEAVASQAGTSLSLDAYRIGPCRSTQPR